MHTAVIVVGSQGGLMFCLVIHVTVTADQVRNHHTTEYSIVSQSVLSVFVAQLSLRGYVYRMQLGIVGVLLPSGELPSHIRLVPASGCYFYAIGLCCSICCGHVALVTPLAYI